MITELGGPFSFGLSAFTLIFAATNLLAISRLIADEHAPLLAAIAYFFWQIPSIIVLVIPMAMLLGTLLALQRLSAESEITAMKAGGISLVRAVYPLLAVGLGISLLALLLQEGVVPYANDRATYLREEVIEHVGAFGGGQLSVTTRLPGGGRQLTTWTAYDVATQTLQNVTLVQYDNKNQPVLIVFSDKARYSLPTWTFTNATEYHIQADGTTFVERVPSQTVDIGQKPSQIALRASANPETMSRAQLQEIMNTGQLSPAEQRTYETSYQEKLARPFASFVFTLIAVPFGLRRSRDGGGAGLGFGLAVAIVFVYFVIASILSALFEGAASSAWAAAIGAWLPNIIFTAIGALLLRRSSST